MGVDAIPRHPFSGRGADAISKMRGELRCSRKEFNVGLVAVGEP